MKTLIQSFIMLISILVTGLVGFRLFREQDYNASSLLILASYTSIVLYVYILTNKKAILS